MAILMSVVSVAVMVAAIRMDHRQDCMDRWDNMDLLLDNMASMVMAVVVVADTEMEFMVVSRALYIVIFSQ